MYDIYIQLTLGSLVVLGIEGSKACHVKNRGKMCGYRHMRCLYSELMTSVMDNLDEEHRGKVLTSLLHSQGLGLVTSAARANANHLPSGGANLLQDNPPVYNPRDYEFIMFSNGDDERKCPHDSDQRNHKYRGISERSLCPWVKTFNVNELRFPPVLPDVKCLCSDCAGHHGGPEACERITHHVPVLYQVSLISVYDA